MKRATITDVAEIAEVSKSTVSHVINNTRFVEDVTRSRVMKVVEELGYQPSLVARNLTTNRTETIGIIVSDVTNNCLGDVLIKTGIQHNPLVFVDRQYEGLSGPFIGVDNYGSARMGVNHLIECVHL